jgi:hypothetical protein
MPWSWWRTLQYFIVLVDGNKAALYLFSGASKEKKAKHQ